jgi:hypothetical protein
MADVASPMGASRGVQVSSCTSMSASNSMAPPKWAVEVPEIVGAEDVAAGPPKRLPALALELVARMHDFVATADVKGDMVQSDGGVRHLHEEQIVVSEYQCRWPIPLLAHSEPSHGQ